MRIAFTLLCIFFLSNLVAQNVNFSFTFDGKNRNCRLYLPASYDGSSAVPLVVSIHGYGGNGPDQQNYDKLFEVADTAGFILAYPTGYQNKWNGGSAYYAGDADEDDVQYISDLIDTIGANYNIDQTRVYACGMSNGGDMSYRLGCELSNKIAAIGPVTGTMISDVYASCNPSNPMPVIHMHGTSDFISNINGGPGWEKLTDALTLFATLNACPSPSKSTLPDLDPSDGSQMRLYQTACGNGAELNLFLAKNGGHTWPGSAPGFGVTNQDINGSAELWKFFRRHNRPSAPLFSKVSELIIKDEIKLFPIPATSFFQLNGELNNGPIKLEVLTVLGNVLFSSNTNWVNGQLEQAVNIEDVPNGFYIISIVQNQIQYTTPLIK